MVTHMKTTIEIADAILRSTKALADRESTTLRALVEEGLRDLLAKRRRAARQVRVKPLVLKGKGFHPDARNLRWNQIIDAVNER